MDPNDYMFRKRNGERLVKLPGSINGNGFVLDTLHDCEVYLLDHTSQVQIDDCINCKIFIGPTDGSIFIRDCKDCTLCVAARQLRTRDCKDLDIALYCATQPSIETSTGVVFSCWRGAYPGLTEHFQRARLDPTKNTWRQVYDFNRTEDLGAPHFRLDESVRPWWTPPAPAGALGVDGTSAAPDCPVPAADGSLFGGGFLAAPQPSNPKGPGAVALPESLPPSPGRAAAYDEEVELDDDEPPTLLPPEVEDGGRSFVAPAQPSPRSEPPGLGPLPLPDAVLDDGAPGAFTFDSPSRIPGPGFGAAALFGAAPVDAAAAVGTGDAASGDAAGGSQVVGGNPFDDFPLTQQPGNSTATTATASEPAAAATAAAATVPAATATAAPLPAAGPLDDFFSLGTAAAAPRPVAVSPAEALLPPPPSQLHALEDSNAAAAAGAAGSTRQELASAVSELPGATAASDPSAAAAASAAAEAETSVTPRDAVTASSTPAAGMQVVPSDARVAWRVANNKQLLELAAQERQARAALQAEAGRKLEAMQQTREARLKQRFATNRAQEQLKGGGGGAAAAAAAGPTGGGAATASGGTVWERVAQLVDLTGGGAGGAASAAAKAGPRPTGPSRDVTRLRQLMITLKSKSGGRHK